MSWMRKNYDPARHILFTPMNVEKYKGNVPLVMRSRYEHQFALWCDNTDKVKWWSSENIRVPYFHPVKGKIVGYWPDFIINIDNKIVLIELKPQRETIAPKMSRRKSLLREQTIFKINMAKWKAAKAFCDKYGWEFKIIVNESLKGK
jgi:hypothetical protein